MRTNLLLNNLKTSKINTLNPGPPSVLKEDDDVIVEFTPFSVTELDYEPM